jgi:hypothetical protein
MRRSLKSRVWASGSKFLVLGATLGKNFLTNSPGAFCVERRSTGNADGTTGICSALSLIFPLAEVVCA